MNAEQRSGIEKWCLALTRQTVKIEAGGMEMGRRERL